MQKYLYRLASLLIPVLCMGWSLQASDYLDSLEALLGDVSTHDSTRIMVYRNIIWPNTWQNGEKALELTAEMMEVAKRNNWQKEVGLAHYYYGTTYKNMDEHDLAIVHIDSSMAMAEARSDSFMVANCAYQKLIVFINAKDLLKAMYWSNQTLTMYRLIGDERSAAMTLNAKGGLLRGLRNYDQSLEAYREALEVYMRIPDSLGMANVYANLGNVYAEIDSFTLALENYGLQEKIDEARKDTFGLGFLYENRGRLYDKMNRLPEALLSLRKSVDIRRTYR